MAPEMGRDLVNNNNSCNNNVLKGLLYSAFREELKQFSDLPPTTTTTEPRGTEVVSQRLQQLMLTVCGYTAWVTPQSSKRRGKHHKATGRAQALSRSGLGAHCAEGARSD